MMKNKGEEQILDCSPLTTGLKHVAVTIDGDNGTAQIYINGELKASKENFTIKPSDINGVCNYIGRSQYVNDPLLKGYVDDFRVYNYVLSAEEVASIVAGEETTTDGIAETMEHANSSSSDTFDLNGRKVSTSHTGIVVKKGNKVVLRR